MDEKFGILPTLNKDYILSRVTQEQIFEYYFQTKVQTGLLLKSPSAVRSDDDDPSFSFYYSTNGKLRAQDFAGYFHGDCFDAVAMYLRINASDKKSFAVILDRIARDFRLHKYEGVGSITSGITMDSREPIKHKEKTIIQFQPRSWNEIDRDFWSAGAITRAILEKGKVYPCEYVWSNNNLAYSYVPKDPAYAYYFGQEDIRIYFPFRQNFRFMSNTSYLQGIDILEPDEVGIITKSYKDVLSMKAFNVEAVAPTSETVMLKKEQWDKCKDTCTHWFSLMDFDRTGILMAKKLRKAYGIQPLFFSNYKLLNKKLKNGKASAYMGAALARQYKTYPTVKDFFDYVKAFGKDKTVELINETREYYSDRFDGYNDEMRDNLNWIK